MRDSQGKQKLAAVSILFSLFFRSFRVYSSIAFGGRALPRLFWDWKLNQILFNPAKRDEESLELRRSE